MIDIARTQQGLDSLGDYPTYSVARLMFPVFNDLLNEEGTANGMNSWLNLGNSSQGGTLSKYNDQMNAYKADIMDTSSHASDAVYANWGAFKSFCMQVVEEANAIEEGTGHTFEDISTSITTDIPDAVAEAPGVIGDVVGSIGAAAGNAVGATAGNLVDSLLEKAGIPLLIGAAVLVFVLIKARG